MNKLNVNRNGGNQTWLKKFIINNNLSIDHFKQNKSKEKCFCLNCGKEIKKKVVAFVIILVMQNMNKINI